MDLELITLLELILENVWLALGAFLVIAYVLGTPLYVYSIARHEMPSVIKCVGEDVSWEDVQQDLSSTYQEGQVSERSLENGRTLTENVLLFFDSTGRYLAEHGFEEVGTLYLPRPVKNAKLLLRLFANRSEQELAVVIAGFILGLNGWKWARRCVNIGTEYHDGTEVGTHNSPDVSSYPIPANRTLATAPWLTDLSELYGAHRAVCQFVCPAKPKELPLDSVFAGDVVAYFGAAMAEEYDLARTAGYLRYTPAEDFHEVSGSGENPYQSPSTSSSASAFYSPTIKGAYLMTWNELWPFKSWNRWRHHRRTKRLLAQVGWSPQKSN